MELLYTKELDHEKLIVRLHSDDIVHVFIKSNVEITVELQDVMVDMYNQITEGSKKPFLFEAGEFVSITRDAREKAITIEMDTPTIASAIIVKNLGQKIIADFYYKINKPKQPYKVFWSKEKGHNWLKQFTPQE